MDNAILQGTLQGSAAVGEKRSNAESAGSQMSRRRIMQMIILIAPNYIGRDNTKVTIPPPLVGYNNKHKLASI